MNLNQVCNIDLKKYRKGYTTMFYELYFKGKKKVNGQLVNHYYPIPILFTHKDSLTSDDDPSDTEFYFEFTVSI